MTDDTRLSIFINSFGKEESPFLEKLYRQAVSDGIPVIRRETAGFIKTMLRITDPGSILEIGTAVGFSAIMMAENTGSSCRITTIENYQKRIAEAKMNISASGYGERITLLEGDASELLDTLAGPYDLVFMDAAKGQYISFLPGVKKLMKKGSVLIADNVLQGGDVAESRYLVERRDRTIHKRMREFLRTVKTDGCFETSIIPLGDGISLSVMK